MLKKIMAHTAIVISGMYFVFFFIDRVNSAMAFIDNDITKVLLFVLCVISVVNSVLLIGAERRAERRRMQRARGKKSARARKA